MLRRHVRSAPRTSRDSSSEPHVGAFQRVHPGGLRGFCCWRFVFVSETLTRRRHPTALPERLRLSRRRRRSRSCTGTRYRRSRPSGRTPPAGTASTTPPCARSRARRRSARGPASRAGRRRASRSSALEFARTRRVRMRVRAPRAVQAFQHEPLARGVHGVHRELLDGIDHGRAASRRARIAARSAVRFASSSSSRVNRRRRERSSLLSLPPASPRGRRAPRPNARARKPRGTPRGREEPIAAAIGARAGSGRASSVVYLSSEHASAVHRSRPPRLRVQQVEDKHAHRRRVAVASLALAKDRGRDASVWNGSSFPV